jgi:hypothetical protein
MAICISAERTYPANTTEQLSLDNSVFIDGLLYFSLFARFRKDTADLANPLTIRFFTAAVLYYKEEAGRFSGIAPTTGRRIRPYHGLQITRRPLDTLNVLPGGSGQKGPSGSR